MSNFNFEVSEGQSAAVEKFAKLIVRLRLTVPAILALESMRPLSFVGSQFMHVMAPAAATLVPFSEWDEVARLLEDRRGVEFVITRIEALDRGATAASAGPESGAPS